MVTVGLVGDDPDLTGLLAAALSAEVSVTEGTPQSSCDVIVVHAPSDPTSRVRELADLAPLMVLGPDCEEALLAAVDAGATSYLPDSAPLAEISQAVQATAKGVAVVPPLMLGALLRREIRRRRRLAAAQEALDTLTTREREVLAHVARGSNRREIAEVLFISPDTVRTHLQRIMAKLDVHSAAELAALAASLGLSQEEP